MRCAGSGSNALSSSDDGPVPDSSPEKSVTNDGSGGISGGKIPIYMSDFQLIEETEKLEQPESTESSPVASLNVRAFKMLEHLRELPKQDTGTASDSSLVPVTTVSENIF